ncbi:TPA: hypothetical protein N2854_001542 [Vibrio parahaemolyticus]|uniref:hypothetical protein n=1 Tax=Vibrio parahaemolyticus TaxID=670 RepID=UPI0007621C4E|nr:hypothetical protein [Vibrio parahaemolyticus]KWU35311.1 hypothetical protein AVL51_00375 [Vibrio parahaemolyticus]HCG7222286.1 hypothetical protein [Vibrio parahaemolyticus]HCM1019926.1 hypothetical protein [Vibrio parahaemolyticus]HCM1046844.1 hypothetical protein [Vibrio parahaemolyticus]HCM1052263.1 hypothetical protein [Vibrio parahaemolyticus]
MKEIQNFINQNHHLDFLNERIESLNETTFRFNYSDNGLVYAKQSQKADLMLTAKELFNDLKTLDKTMCAFVFAKSYNPESDREKYLDKVGNLAAALLNQDSLKTVQVHDIDNLKQFYQNLPDFALKSMFNTDVCCFTIAKNEVYYLSQVEQHVYAMSKTMFRDDYETIREVIIERGEEIEFMSPYLPNTEVKALTPIISELYDDRDAIHGTVLCQTVAFFRQGHKMPLCEVDFSAYGLRKQAKYSKHMLAQNVFDLSDTDLLNELNKHHQNVIDNAFDKFLINIPEKIISIGERQDRARLNKLAQWEALSDFNDSIDFTKDARQQQNLDAGIDQHIDKDLIESLNFDFTDFDASVSKQENKRNKRKL